MGGDLGGEVVHLLQRVPDVLVAGGCRHHGQLPSLAQQAVDESLDPLGFILLGVLRLLVEGGHAGHQPEVPALGQHGAQLRRVISGFHKPGAEEIAFEPGLECLAGFVNIGRPTRGIGHDTHVQLDTFRLARQKVDAGAATRIQTGEDIRNCLPVGGGFVFADFVEAKQPVVQFPIGQVREGQRGEIRCVPGQGGNAGGELGVEGLEQGHGHGFTVQRAGTYRSGCVLCGSPGPCGGAGFISAAV